MSFNKYSKKGLIKSLIVISIFALGINIIFPSRKETLCSEKQSMLQESINALIIKKYIDKDNHNYEIVEYIDLSDSTRAQQRLNLSLDKSGLFEIVQADDQMIKKKGSLRVTINNDTTILINYGVNCDQEN